jgi:hypothetical protein
MDFLWPQETEPTIRNCQHKYSMTINPVRVVCVVPNGVHSRSPFQEAMYRARKGAPTDVEVQVIPLSFILMRPRG